MDICELTGQTAAAAHCAIEANAGTDPVTVPGVFRRVFRRVFKWHPLNLAPDAVVFDIVY